MPFPAKPLIVTLVAAVTFAFGAAPATAAEPVEDFAAPAAVAPAVPTQSLSTDSEAIADQALEAMMQSSELASTPHGFDVEATIEAAKSEIGTSRATGWSQPGECIMSAQRWVKAGGGAWNGGGTPVSNYVNATRLLIGDAQPGDIIQYEHIASPDSWVSGVHTLLIVGVNDDGTFDIIESNNPGGSGLVSEDEHWTPKPPEGFQAVVWRF